MKRAKKEPRLRTAALRTLGTVSLLLVSGWILHKESRKPELYDITVVPPTCLESGYSLYTNRQSGSTEVRDVVPATGHSFGHWATLREAAGADCGLRQRDCTLCGESEQQALYPELTIPRLSLYGSTDGITKDDEVPLTAEFVSDELSFTSYAKAKYQGHVSMTYDKKNYSLKLYSDEGLQKKNLLTLSHWNPENRYILKANYIDPSMSRNLLCADIWAEMVSSRENLPGQLAALSNYGAVDGFPVALYINDAFQGLYTMNLHKDEDLFGMEEGKQQAIMNINHTFGEEAFFRDTSQFTEDSAWEVEFCGTGDQTWAMDKLNGLITFVRTSDDETFRAELGSYLDVDGAIDYLIAMYALGLPTHGATDLVLFTYGPEEPWIPSLYDMENGFGLYDEGDGFYDAAEFLPGGDSATGSLLWDRIWAHFFPELQARYAQLRQTTLDTDALCARVDEFVGRIPQALYEADASANGTTPFDGSQAGQIKTYLRQRLDALDSIFLTEKG